MVSRKLLIATTNPGKVREVARYLDDIPDLTLLSLRDIPPIPAVPEEGKTFEENAVAKAVGYSRSFGGLTVADDSGICVEALGGGPGVGSARFGGPGLDGQGRNRHLLEQIAGVEEGRRGAWYECVLALASNGRLVQLFRGRADGRILTEPRGMSGFGYDPLFYYEPAGRTFAEMGAEEKDAVSHRGLALAGLRQYLLDHPSSSSLAPVDTPGGRGP
jgi:XTP/dITP diphosphohydrolase